MSEESICSLFACAYIIELLYKTHLTPPLAGGTAVTADLTAPCFFFLFPSHGPTILRNPTIPNVSLVVKNVAKVACRTDLKPP